MHHSLLSLSPTVIVESQIFAKINNAEENSFVHKAFVRLFLQDWFLKEELMSKCAKTRVMINTKFFPERLNQFAFGGTPEHGGLASTFFNRKKNFLEEF